MLATNGGRNVELLGWMTVRCLVRWPTVEEILYCLTHKYAHTQTHIQTHTYAHTQTHTYTVQTHSNVIPIQLDHTTMNILSAILQCNDVLSVYVYNINSWQCYKLWSSVLREHHCPSWLDALHSLFVLSWLSSIFRKVYSTWFLYNNTVHSNYILYVLNYPRMYIVKSTKHHFETTDDWGIWIIEQCQLSTNGLPVYGEALNALSVRPFQFSSDHEQFLITKAVF